MLSLCLRAANENPEVLFFTYEIGKNENPGKRVAGRQGGGDSRDRATNPISHRSMRGLAWLWHPGNSMVGFFVLFLNLVLHAHFWEYIHRTWKYPDIIFIGQYKDSYWSKACNCENNIMAGPGCPRMGNWLSKPGCDYTKEYNTAVGDCGSIWKSVRLGKSSQQLVK